MSTQKNYMVMVLGLVLLALMMGCTKSSDPKVANAKKSVNAVTEDVKDALTDAQAAFREEWLQFTRESETKFAANNKVIAEYKAKMTTAEGKLQAAYDKKIDMLDKKNKELKAKLDEWKDDGKSDWAQFKSELNRDLETLGNALKDFNVDNTK